MAEQSDSSKAAAQPAVLQATIHQIVGTPVKDEPKKEAQ